MLMTATVAATIGQFNMRNIEILQKEGYEVHVACNFLDEGVWSLERARTLKNDLKEIGVRCHQIDYSRNPMCIKNHILAYRQLKKIMKEYRYELMHCHTPIAAAIARIAAHQTKCSSIYTAHGFHFYKGAPLKNWMMLYPVEWLVAHWTDVLITINREDYQRAQKHFHAKRVCYVPGVGIDLERFYAVRHSVDTEHEFDENSSAAKNVRAGLGIKDSDILLFSVGELSDRKNHKVVIQALAQMNRQDIYYVVCGSGGRKTYLSQLINELGLQKNVKLLGYQENLNRYYNAADLYLFPSYQEGLPVALMEAIACKIPVLCSRIRGNVDLVKEGLFDADDVKQLHGKLEALLVDRETVHEKMMAATEDNYKRLQAFSNETVDTHMHEIYRSMKNSMN